jgi:hypothetical protein
MRRSSLSLLVLAGLLPGIAIGATNPPAANTAAVPAAASMTTPSAAQPEPAASDLQMPATESAPEVSTLPARGMDMANVEHIYGAPLEKLTPVPAKGTPKHPPITRWVYPAFVVYFEYNHVVHAVTKAHPFKDTAGNHE